MIWIFYLFLLIVFGLIVLYVVEAWIDLDRWIAERPQREAVAWDYEKNEPVKKLTIQPQKPMETVKKPTPKLENFPQNSQEAKARIEKLLAEAKKSA